MNRQLHRCPDSSVAGLCLAALLMSAGEGIAQPADVTAADEPETIDEIVVYGEMSLIQLQREIIRAEVRLFDVFNSLNSNDEFDVECEYIRRVGTRKRIHRCTPRFALEAQREASYEVKAGSEISGAARSGAPMYFESFIRKPRLREKDERLWQELAGFVRKDPEIQAALIDLVNAQKAYESERATVCDGKGLFCE